MVESACSSTRLPEISPSFSVKRRRRPIGGPTGQPIADSLTVVIDGIGLLSEGGAVIQAIRVDDGAGARGGFADGADINAAALADQEVGGARAKAVVFNQRPVGGVDIDRSVGIAGRARV